MSKIAVVYWSGTGNTEAMAKSVAAGARSAGAEVELLPAAEFGPDKLSAYDAAAFGCPAMGSEQLEEDEFEPMGPGSEEGEENFVELPGEYIDPGTAKTEGDKK